MNRNAHRVQNTVNWVERTANTQLDFITFLQRLDAEADIRLQTDWFNYAYARFTVTPKTVCPITPPLISSSLWSGDVVLIHLAAAKKVVTHHAADKHEEQDGQDHDKQEPCKSRPR